MGWIESLMNSIRSGWNSLVSWLSNNKWNITCTVGGGLIIFGGVYYGGLIGGVIGAGGVVVGAAVIYQAFRYDPNRRQVSHALLNVSDGIQNLNLQQAQWQLLDVSDQELLALNNIVDQAQFQQDAKALCCPYNGKVIIKPAMINNHTCSQGKKIYQENKLRLNMCCKFCRATINQSQIVTDSPQTRGIKNQIFGFRCQIRKKYHQLSEDQKPDWKILIEKYMGNGYVDTYL